MYLVYLLMNLLFDLDDQDDIDEKVQYDSEFYYNHDKKYHQDDQLMVDSYLPKKVSDDTRFYFIGSFYLSFKNPIRMDTFKNIPRN